MKQVGIICSGSRLNFAPLLHVTDKYLFYGTTLGVYVLNAATFSVEKILKCCDRQMCSFAVSPHNENLLVSVGNDGTILLWNIEEVFVSMMC